MAFYDKGPSLVQPVNGPKGPIVVPDKRLPGLRLKASMGDPAERKLVRPIYPNYGPSYDYTVKDQDEIIFTLNSLDPRVMLNMDKSTLIVGVYLVFPDDATYWTDYTKAPQSGLRYTFLAQPLLTSEVKAQATNLTYCKTDQTETEDITMGGWVCDFKYGAAYYRNVAALHNEFIWRGTHTLFQRIQIKNINSSRIVEEINLADVLTQLSLSSLSEDMWSEMAERYGCSYWRPVPCVPCGSETNTIISNSGSGPCLNIGKVGTSATVIAGTSSVVASDYTNDLAVSYCGLFFPGTNNLQVNETASASMTADSVTFRTTNFSKQVFPNMPVASWLGIGAGSASTTTATDLGSYPIANLNPNNWGPFGAASAGSATTNIAFTSSNYQSQSWTGSGTTSTIMSSVKHARMFDKGPQNSEIYKLLLSSKTNCAEWEYLLPSEYLRNGQLIWLKPEAFELRLQFNNPNDVFHIKRFGNWWVPDANHPKTKLPPTYYNDDLMYPVIHVYNCRINACFETFSDSTVSMLQQAWASEVGIVKDFDSWWTFKPNDITAGSSNASIMIQANDIHNMKSVFIVLCRRANIATTGEDKYHFSTGEFYGNCNPLRTDTGYVNSLQFFVGNDPYPESPIVMSPIKRVEMREYVREALHGGSLLKVKDSLLDDLFLGYAKDPLYVLDQRSSSATLSVGETANGVTTSTYGGFSRSYIMENSYCSGLNCNFMMAYDFRRHDHALSSGLNLEGRNLYINLTFAGTSKVALVPYVFICAEKTLVLKPTITSVLT